jgi:HrpA-like RNA helicase
MDEFAEPEILKSPLDQTVLQLKSIGAKDLLQFPFVTMPPLPALVASLRHLTILGALKLDSRQQLDDLLQHKITREDNTEVTDLGSLLSKIPLSPKFSKMLILSTQQSVLRYVIMIVACLSVQELFRELPQSQTE